MIEYLLLVAALLVGFSYKRFCRHVAILFLAVATLFASLNPIIWIFLLIGAVSLILHENARPEEASLVLFLVAGAVGVINATNLFYVYIFFEIGLVASYFMIFRKSKKEIMALSRYFIMSSVGTAFILFGLAMLWSDQGSFFIGALEPGLYSIFLFVGFATKMGLIPFHMWVPRTYDVAKTSVLLLFAGVLNKVGVIGIKVFLPLVSSNLNLTFAVISIISMTIANLSALSERNIKRLLAYSSIAHMSYILFGFTVGATLGSMVHIVGHAITISCAFVCAGIIVEKFGTTDLKKLRGAATSNQLIAFSFMISILALAGIPLFPMFISELLIFISSSSYSIWLSAAFGFNIILSIAYYVNLIRTVELSETKKEIRLKYNEKFVLILLTLLIIIFGLFPGILTNAFGRIL